MPLSDATVALKSTWISWTFGFLDHVYGALMCIDGLYEFHLEMRVSNACYWYFSNLHFSEVLLWNCLQNRHVSRLATVTCQFAACPKLYITCSCMASSNRTERRQRCQLSRFRPCTFRCCWATSCLMPPSRWWSKGSCNLTYQATVNFGKQSVSKFYESNLYW